jgi:putative membrane protein insertion efficiency factor
MACHRIARSSLSVGLLARGLLALPARALVLMLVAVVRAYQVGISPLLVGSCKFVPSCSEYFITAVSRHGPWRGLRLASWRILRCHPFAPGGCDPVPPRRDTRRGAGDGLVR